MWLSGGVNTCKALDSSLAPFAGGQAPPPLSLQTLVFPLQPLKDIHLVLFVLVFLLVDVVILVICTSLDTVRLTADLVPDREHDSALDVSMHVVREHTLVPKCWVAVIYL